MTARAFKERSARLLSSHKRNPQLPPPHFLVPARFIVYVESEWKDQYLNLRWKRERRLKLTMQLEFSRDRAMNLDRDFNCFSRTPAVLVQVEQQLGYGRATWQGEKWFIRHLAHPETGAPLPTHLPLIIRVKISETQARLNKLRALVDVPHDAQIPA